MKLLNFKIDTKNLITCKEGKLVGKLAEIKTHQNRFEYIGTVLVDGQYTLSFNGIGRKRKDCICITGEAFDIGGCKDVVYCLELKVSECLDHYHCVGTGCINCEPYEFEGKLKPDLCKQEPDCTCDCKPCTCKPCDCKCHCK